MGDFSSNQADALRFIGRRYHFIEKIKENKMAQWVVLNSKR